MSTYDMLIAEGEKIGEIRGELKGKKEEQKKRTLEIILSIRSALRKRLAINTIALILNVSTDYVKKTQVELQKEVDVLELLKSQLFVLKRIISSNFSFKVGRIISPLYTINTLYARKKYLP